MTAMPQMVSLFNGMGGACAALISISEYEHLMQRSGTATVGVLLNMVAGLVIGSVSFSGSLIAFAKLPGIMKKNIRLPFYNIINILLMRSEKRRVGTECAHTYSTRWSPYT